MSPFKSDKQRRYLYWKHPEIAKKWSKEEKKQNHNQSSNKGARTFSPKTIR